MWLTRPAIPRKNPGVDRDATWRLFVALELPESMGQYLVRQQRRVREQLPGDHVRWVRPGGIHLTLRFLGAVPPQRLPVITAANTNIPTVVIGAKGADLVLEDTA